MKKIALALPAILAAAIAVSACSPKSDAGDNVTATDITVNDEDAVTENSFGNGADALGENTFAPDDATANGAVGNTAAPGAAATDNAL